MLTNFYNSITQKESFTRHFSITLLSNIIVLFVGFAFTPIFSRIYSPEAYGIFGLFGAIAQNFSNIATLQFTRGFVIPREEEVFYDLVRISFLSVVFFSLISGILFLLFGPYLLALFHSEKLADWIYFCPVAIFFLGLNDILRSWSVRAKEFAKAAYINLVTVISVRSVTLGLGLFTGGAAVGMIIGDFVGKPMESFLLRRKAGTACIFWKGYDFKRLYQVAIKHKSYPLFVLPGNWLNIFSNQLPLYLLVGPFGPSIVGYYNQANSLLNIPMTVIVTALAPLFLQKSAITYRENPGDMSRLISQLYNRLFYIGLVPFCILTVFGETIFGFFLGEAWRTSGVFAGYMGMYFMVWIISSPLNSLYRIYSKEHWNFLINVGVILLKVAAIMVGVWQQDYTKSILYFSVATLIGHLIHLWVGFKLVNLNFFKTFIKSAVAATVTYIIFMWLKNNYLNV